MRIYSWNVNGIRAIIKKNDFKNFLENHNPDILCLQEIKATPDQIKLELDAYEKFWNPASRAGYAGTAIFIKRGIKVLKFFKNFEKFPDLKISLDDFGDPLSEGRISTVELENFFLVNVYTPNSKRKLERLKLRENSWDPTFRKYLKLLEQEKPVVVCGDFNAAHTEIDLARPKDNIKNAGFTSEERDGITNLINSDFIDTFRDLHEDEIRYTWWSYLGHSRERNIGWRIDYFFISENLKNVLKTAEIHDDIFGSDHCPISIELEEK